MIFWIYPMITISIHSVWNSVPGEQDVFELGLTPSLIGCIIRLLLISVGTQSIRNGR
ncbi:hypothetical protein BC943DRAFT_326519 [Umbelopsis sp. AD052]|nr:hypothetical protein BC943DRAFT_326519 [Umbelopsis sp. AD052]